MPTSTPLTVDLPAAVQEKLDQLSTDTRRSPESLAAEAIAAYAEHELAIIEGIKRGLADVDAGRVVPHDQAMSRLRATVAAAEGLQADKK